MEESPNSEFRISMITKEVLKQIRGIEIRTGRLVNEVFSGQYSSVFKGRGMEFEEVREYQPGDDIRTIDWNVTARFGRPFVKKFIEERELTVMLVVDASGSLAFGTRCRLKSEMAAELAAVLSFSAIRNNDKVGLIVFTDRVEKFVRPKKGRRHILRLIREILYFKPKGKGTDMEQALEYLNEVTRRRAIVFLISDFLEETGEKALRITNKRHDLIALILQDPGEKEMPRVGWMEMEDPETGEMLIYNTRLKEVRQKFSLLNKNREEKWEKFFQQASLDHVWLINSESYVRPLIRFFRMRARRFR